MIALCIYLYLSVGVLNLFVQGKRGRYTKMDSCPVNDGGLWRFMDTFMWPVGLTFYVAGRCVRGCGAALYLVAPKHRAGESQRWDAA